MALPVITKDEAPKGPSQEDVLATERAARERLEQQYREDRAAYQARLEMMERSLNRPAPGPASPEPERLSAEAIAADPEKGLQLLRESIANDLRKQYEPTINSLRDTAFQSEVEALKGKKYFSDVEPELRKYFDEHPEARQPGAAKQAYAVLVGQNLETLEKRHDYAGGGIEKNYGAPSYSEAPIRTSGGPLVTDNPGNEAVRLTEAEEQERQYWNGFGVNISPREWAEIQAGRVFPKGAAMDWETTRHGVTRDRKVAKDG